MDQVDVLQRIADLEREIALLPPGSVTTKKVKGREYYYHRYTSNGKRSEIYVDMAEAEELRTRIEKRKALEAELKELKRSMPAVKTKRQKQGSHKFRTSVRLGEQLKSWAKPAENFKQRECYNQLRQYVFGDGSDRVFILYGLRRTGKTTLIRQIVLDMTEEQIEKAAFIQMKRDRRKFCVIDSI